MGHRLHSKIEKLNMRRFEEYFSSLKSFSSDDWRRQLEHASGSSACSALFDGALAETAARYPFRVTPYYLSLADISDPEDPILRQCLPDSGELHCEDGATDDPFSEDGSAPAGMVHRFPDRVLIVGGRECAVYCRHCTRKNVLSRVATVWDSGLDTMQQYLRAHPMVREVLVSGGDPLLLPDDRLRSLLAAIREVPSVEVVRIGTRVPVVLPMRVTRGLCEMLREFAPIWVNTQFNHPRELSAEAVKACGLMVDHGIPVSNQSVLLRGVNDDADCMVELCAALQRARVRPYYVFLCDPVKGVAPFRVALERAVAIADAVEKRLGGLAVPRFVADVPGAAAKVSIRSLLQADYQ